VGVSGVHPPARAGQCRRITREDRPEKDLGAPLQSSGAEPYPYIGAELPLKDHDLVTQSENLDILVTITHRQ
jgi:hypothetical protein